MPCQTRLFISFLTFLAILGGTPLGCKRKPPEGAQVTFTMEHFEKKYQDCKDPTADCTYVKMDFPTFTGGTNAEALKKLNMQVQEWLNNQLFEKKSKNLESLTKEFFQAYGDFKKEMPDAPGGWTVERNVAANQISPRILILDMSEYTFTGGAHPNGFERFLNINPQTGELYSLGDLFVPDAEKKLTTVGEEIFRKQKDLKPNQSLGEAGYFFQDDKFYLNNNFLINPEDITFLYNAYEIAPYVMGPIELKIPYASIKDLVRKDGPLNSFLKTSP